MFNPIKVITALAFLALAAPLYAQDATDPVTDPATDPAAEPATDPATDPVPDPATDLSMGSPVEAGPPQVGEPYIREAFGDWSLRCLKAETGEDPCQLYQLLMDADGNAVAEISMFPLPAGGEAAAGATIVAPLETLLTEQITISVDGTATRRYPFTFCNRAGCVARVGFTAAEVAQFKAGNSASMRIIPAAAPDQEVVLNISLVGFTAGYDGTDTPPTAPQE
jgi:invasion protein IalB